MSTQCQIQEFLDWSASQGVHVNIQLDEVKGNNFSFVEKLFPVDEEEYYIEHGDPVEIKIKYVLYHCLMEIWYSYNKPDKCHRTSVFNKVMRGKRECWSGCDTASQELLSPFGFSDSPVEYFSKFDKKHFDAVGI